jgi:hypothetical protein
LSVFIDCISDFYTCQTTKTLKKIDESIDIYGSGSLMVESRIVDPVARVRFPLIAPLLLLFMKERDLKWN